MNRDISLLSEAYKQIREMAYGIAGEGGDQQRITKDELVNVIRQIEEDRPGTNFIGVTQVTKESTNKPVPDPTAHARGQQALFPRFVLPGLLRGETYFAKVSQVGGRIGHDYQGEMRRTTGDETFTSGGFRSGMTRVEGSKVIVQKPDGYYISYRPQSVSKDFSPVILHAEGDGFQTIDRETVAQWKRPFTGTAIPVRTVSINSIAAISINGQEYIISDLDPVREAIYDASGAPLKAPQVEEGAPEQ